MRYDTNPFSGLPVVVKNLLIINVIMFLLKLTGLGDLAGERMEHWFALHYFSSPLFKPWQLVTHMFMHGDGKHLFLNMLGLFMLGPPLEYKWGSERFLTFYMVTGVGAALFYSGVHLWEYLQLRDMLSAEQYAEVLLNGTDVWNTGRYYTNSAQDQLNALFNIPMVGASGAIYGVLLAFGMTYPNVQLMMFPLPIPIQAKYFVLLLGGMSVYSALQSNPGDNVAHLAHLGGMVVGFVLIRLWRGRGL